MYLGTEKDENFWITFTNLAVKYFEQIRIMPHYSVAAMLRRQLLSFSRHNAYFNSVNATRALRRRCVHAAVSDVGRGLSFSTLYYFNLCIALPLHHFNISHLPSPPRLSPLLVRCIARASRHRLSF
jgi:hypothetical protein